MEHQLKTSENLSNHNFDIMHKSIGIGSEAIIYIATHKATNLKVCIKTFKHIKQNTHSNILQKQLQLDHPNILKIYNSYSTVYSRL